MKHRRYLFWPAALAALCVACGDGNPPVPTLHDAVWCDITAIPCLIAGEDTDGGVGSCAVVGDEPVPASVPGGDRACFDRATQTPQEACNAFCDPSAHQLSTTLYPQDPVNCLALVNHGPMHQAGLTAEGFLPNGCTNTPQDEYPFLSGAGTSSFQVAGTATVSYAGATQPISVHSGLFNVAAPDTSCTALESSCGTQVNQIELAFDDIQVADLALNGLTIVSDGPFYTASGQTFAAPPANTFSFDLPQFAVFDAIGDIQGAFQAHGFPITSDQSTFATLNLDTGGATFDFSFTATLGNGKKLAIAGTATTAQIVDLAPVVTLPASPVVDAAGACSVSMTLNATAASAVGAPVTLSYVVDDVLLGANGSVELTVGAHQVTVVAIDSFGEQGSATELFTVTSSAKCP